MDNFLAQGEVDNPLTVYKDEITGDETIVIYESRSYADIARHFVRHDPVGAEELHRILGEMLSARSET